MQVVPPFCSIQPFYADARNAAPSDAAAAAEDCDMNSSSVQSAAQQTKSASRSDTAAVIAAPTQTKLKNSPAQPATLLPPVVVAPILLAVTDPDPASAALFSPHPWHKAAALQQQQQQQQQYLHLNSVQEPQSELELLRLTAHRTTLQFSIHSPGRHLSREIALVFPCLVSQHIHSTTPALPQAGAISDLLVIPTFQESMYNLVGITPESNWERDILLEYFYAFGKLFCEFLHAHGHWADLTDPASGYPVYSDRGTSLYPDVDGCARLLKYATHLAGCCRVLDHPVWGTRSYPATMFTTAPLELTRQALEHASVHGHISLGITPQ
eukprot:jgi/Hompol1/3604/HPOL_006674-RA